MASIQRLANRSFGEIKRRAFSILERDKIQRAAAFIGANSIDLTALEWEFVGPVFKERIRTDFSNPFLQEMRKSESNRRLLLSFYVAVSLDLAIAFGDPLATHFIPVSIAIDFFVALLQ
jgi:hypothetical protein